MGCKQRPDRRDIRLNQKVLVYILKLKAFLKQDVTLSALGHQSRLPQLLMKLACRVGDAEQEAEEKQTVALTSHTLSPLHSKMESCHTMLYFCTGTDVCSIRQEYKVTISRTRSTPQLFER